jgi:AcrR family transcriptional regulator
MHGSPPAKDEAGTMARHIARAAARLFASRGYDATPVRAIVEAAGVTKPTLYYHFGSKEGLAQALLTVPMTQLVASKRRILEQSGNPIHVLEEMLESDFAFCRVDPDRARFMYALFFGPLGSSLSAELAQFGEELTKLLVEATRRLAEAGIVATNRVEPLTAALRGLTVIHTMDFLYRGKTLGHRLASRLVGDLLRGFSSTGCTEKRASQLRTRS